MDAQFPWQGHAEPFIGSSRECAAEMVGGDGDGEVQLYAIVGLYGSEGP